jgi:hypothetical protein
MPGGRGCWSTDIQSAPVGRAPPVGQALGPRPSARQAAGGFVGHIALVSFFQGPEDLTLTVRPSLGFYIQSVLELDLAVPPFVHGWLIHGSEAVGAFLNESVAPLCDPGCSREAPSKIDSQLTIRSSSRSRANRPALESLRDNPFPFRELAG